MKPRKALFLLKTAEILYGLATGWVLLTVTFRIGIEWSWGPFLTEAAVLLLILVGSRLCCAGGMGQGLIERVQLNHRNMPDDPQRFYRSLAIMTLIFALCETVITWNTFFLTGWDVGNLRTVSMSLAQGGANPLWEYYQYCSNNLLMTEILTLIRRVLFRLHITAQEGWIAVITSMNAVVSSFLAGCIGRKITGSDRAGKRAFLLCALLLGLNLWMAIPYTDAWAVTFVMLILFLALVPGERFPWLLREILLLSSGLAGFLIKPACAIALIAVYLVRLAAFPALWKTRNLLQWAKCAGVILLLVGELVSIYPKVSNGLYAFCRTYPDASKELPPLHYVALSLNTASGGSFSQEETARTNSYASREEKNAACLRDIRDRIKTFGAKGLMVFEQRKLLYTWRDGTFTWEMMTGAYQESVPDAPWGSFSKFLRQVFHADGRLFPVLQQLMQFLWILVLNGAAWNGINSRFDGLQVRCRMDVLRVSVIGILLYTLLFEQSGRYLLPYVPVMVLLCVCGASVKIIID